MKEKNKNKKKKKRMCKLAATSEHFGNDVAEVCSKHAIFANHSNVAYPNCTEIKASLHLEQELHWRALKQLHV